MTVLIAPVTTNDREAGPRFRTSDEIEEFGNFYCFMDRRCIAEQKRVGEEGLYLRESTDDPGVIDNATWRRCVDAGCRLWDCGMPALSTILPWLLTRPEMSWELVTGLVDTYDLRHARAILERAHSLRHDRIQACRPPRPAGQVPPVDQYERAERLYTGLYFLIEPDGSLAGIRVNDEALAGHPEVASCLVDAFRGLTFPPSIHGDVIEVHEQVHLAPRPSHLD